MGRKFDITVLLVFIALGGVFAFQGYWLGALYSENRQEMETEIEGCMRVADYHEMMVRVEYLKNHGDRHGEISISAGMDGNTALATIISDSNGRDSSKAEITVRRKEADEGAHDEDRVLEQIFGTVDNGTNMAMMMLSGMHHGIDGMIGQDYAVYDSLLVVSLAARGIPQEHRLTVYGPEKDTGKAVVYACFASEDFRKPGGGTYEYTLVPGYTFILEMGPLSGAVLGKMTGVLLMSVFLMLIVLAAFWYLIRVIRKQQELNDMKSDFTNNITHELKTPIAVAYAANDVLLNMEDSVGKELREKYLKISLEQMDRLSGLVEQILSMSMEKRRSLRMHTEAVDVARVFETLAERHRLKSRDRVEITVSVSEGLTCLADAGHFANVIDNLLDNAVKYSAGNAVVKLSAEKSGDYVVIAVEDNGIGMEPSALKHIFEKYYRVPDGNLHDVKGYGLGLYYVRDIADRHGWKISVESTPGRGSRFVIKAKQA